MKAVRKFDPSKEELERLYQFYSCEQIGKQFGVNAETVRKRLHEHGIKALGVGGRRAFDPPKEVLEQLYQSKSMKDIAKHFGVGETVVFKRLKEHGIELKEHKNHRLKPGRSFSEETRKKMSEAQLALDNKGEKNPNWKGGLTVKNFMARNSREARQWKKESLQRSKYKCEVCGITDGAGCECCGVKIKLHVHHIKSFAKFPDIRFDPTNSEVLCPKCHAIRHNRKIG